MNWEHFISQGLVYRLGWTLLHSLWEVGVIGVGIAVALVCMRRASAQARYVVGIVGLALMFAAPVVTFCLVEALVVQVRPALIEVNTVPQPRWSVGFTEREFTGGGAKADVPAAEPVSMKEWARGAAARAREKANASLPWLVCVWGGGVALLALWQTGGWVAAQRLKSLGTLPVWPATEEVFTALAARMRVSQPVRLMRSFRVNSPMVVGWWKPIILMPAAVITQLTPAQLEAILAHELAHVQRNDYLVNLMQSVVETLLFYHPAVWWVSRRIRLEREHCCDDVAAAICADPSQYAKALISLEELRSMLPLPSVAARGSRGGEFLARIRRVLSVKEPARSANPWLGVGMVVLVVVAGVFSFGSMTQAQTTKVVKEAAATQPKAEGVPTTMPSVAAATTQQATMQPVKSATTQPAASKTPAPTMPTRSMVFEMIDAKTRQPLSGVAVSLEASVGKERFTSSAKSDEDGNAAVSVPVEEVRMAYFTLRKAGYVPMIVRWPSGSIIAGPTYKLPERYTFAMPPGREIGGRVLDDAGQPVDGATVTLSLRKGKTEAPEQMVGISYEYAKTNAEGKWVYKTAPEEFEEISVGAYHPRYDNGGGYGFYGIKSFSAAQVKDGSAVFTLNRGVPIEGVVYGSNGKPLVKAAIGIGEDRVASNTIPNIYTDKEGRYFLAGPAGGNIMLTIRAAGHAPFVKQLHVDPSKMELDFHLEASKVLRGRVVDTKGNPIQGVTVIPQKWRNTRSSPVYLSTNAEGRFVWKDAPADAVEFEILKQGYADVRNRPLVAGDEEIVITMSDPTVVTGTVVDAETGGPIAAFDVVRGIIFPNQGEAVPGKKERVHWQREAEVIHRGKDGKFRYEVGFPYPAYVARVEAEGYAPADSRVYKPDEGKVDLQFKLVRAKNVTGLVRNAEGKAVAGAEVALVVPGTHLQLVNGSIYSSARRDLVIVKTDGDGKFSFSPQIDPYGMVVVSDQGYGECSEEGLAKDGEIKLQPWGRVEGVMVTGQQPSVRKEVRGDPMTSIDVTKTLIYHNLTATTDENGRFVMERVPLGKIRIGRTVRPNSYTMTSTQMVVVDAKAGHTAHVQIGGTGRPVVGRIEISNELKAFGTYSFGYSSMLTKIETEPPMPDEVKKGPVEERRKWYDDFIKSEAGKAFQADVAKQNQERKLFPITVEADGSFRLDDVPAGTYQLAVSVEQTQAEMCGGESIGFGKTEVVVPEMPSGRDDNPLVVPMIKLTLISRVKEGDVAPVFKVKSLEGKEITLEEYRGKFTMLIFWATWCPPCVAEVPQLKAVHEAFGANEKFAMIGLSMDAEAETARKFVTKQDIKWAQGFLGMQEKSPVRDSFGVTGIPSVWLVGPDGKVVAKNIQPGDLKGVVEKALGGREKKM